MASSRRSDTLLLEQLQAEILTFNDDLHPLLKYQHNASQLCCQLLRDDSMSQRKMSIKHCYARLRAQTFLLDVFTGLASEVFLLCTLAVLITDLSKISHKHIFPKLQEWWKAAPHPEGLTKTANELCRVNSIRILTTVAKKRQSPEDFTRLRSLFLLVARSLVLLQGTLDSSSSKRIQPELCPTHTEECPHTTRQNEGLRDWTPKLNSQAANPSPEPQLLHEQGVLPSATQDCVQDMQGSTMIDIGLKDLLNVLQQHEIKDSKLRMQCPWNGVPQPSIDITPEVSSVFSGKIELSVPVALM